MKYMIENVEGTYSKHTNTTSVIRSKRGRTREIWLTEAQLASSTWMNDAAAATVAITTMQSKRHENAALAEKGWKQYQHFYEIKDESLEEKDEATVVTGVDLTAEEAALVRTDMLANTFPESTAESSEAIAKYAPRPPEVVPAPDTDDKAKKEQAKKDRADARAREKELKKEERIGKKKT